MNCVDKTTLWLTKQHIPHAYGQKQPRYLGSHLCPYFRPSSYNDQMTASLVKLKPWQVTCKCFSRLGAWANECAGKYWVERRIQEYPFCFCSRLSGDLVARYFFSCSPKSPTPLLMREALASCDCYVGSSSIKKSFLILAPEAVL